MPPNPISLSELESHLWESANILRGPVDAADFKTYIFPLLFFKRTLDDIKAEDWTLNISRYVLPPLQEDIPPCRRRSPLSRKH